MSLYGEVSQQEKDYEAMEAHTVEGSYEETSGGKKLASDERSV
jgi:hypothetical protein